jgi:hypothetical protein
MNPKQLKRIAIALVVVLVFWGLSEILGGRPNDTELGRVLPILQETDVDSIVIESAADTTVLSREGDTWTVNGLEASRSALDELFAALGDSTESELSATSQLVHERMGVDSVAGIHLTLMNEGKPVASVIFGKSGRGYDSRYVRRADGDYVYTYTGALARLVDRKPNDWRDKRIADVPPDSVQRVVARRGADRYSLRRQGDEWFFDTGEAVDSAKIRRMLQQYQRLDATSFPTAAQLDSVDLGSPDREVALFGSAGDTLAALLFDSTNAAYWVQKASGGYVYRVLSWRVDQMVPADSTLKSR